MSKEYSRVFYRSKQWQDTRSAYISTVNGLCERCLKRGQHTPGYIVHHKKYITPENINNPVITLSFDNLEYVCSACHNYIHYGKYIMRDDVMFDEDGNIISTKLTKERKERNVYIVWGSPASGKTAYVKEHIQYKDMIIDLDMIRESIGGASIDVALKT